MILQSSSFTGITVVLGPLDALVGSVGLTSELVSVLNWSVWSVSVSIFVFRFLDYCYYRFQYYRYVLLSVSKFRSLERGGVSELSQAQVDR